MKRLLAATGLLLGNALAQTPHSEFEAVSIRPDKSGEFAERIHPSPGGRFTATNVTAKTLIEWAYGVRSFQLSGEPGWVDSERFDVEAKANGNPTYDFFHPALEILFRGVLEDRFKLASHTVTKDLPVYFLAIGKGGLKIHAVDEGDCPEVPARENACRSLRAMAFAQLNAQRTRMPALAEMLVNFVGRQVIDRTDLKCSFTYTLDWKKYLDPPRLPPGVASPPNAFDPASMEPAIATALEEQLGLRLESGKGPVETLVVDHVERPSAN